MVTVIVSHSLNQGKSLYGASRAVKNIETYLYYHDHSEILCTTTTTVNYFGTRPREVAWSYDLGCSCTLSLLCSCTLSLLLRRAPGQEGKKNVAQFKQFYPNLSPLSPHYFLLPTLSQGNHSLKVHLFSDSDL